MAFKNSENSAASEGIYARGVVVFDYVAGKQRWFHSTGPTCGDVAFFNPRANASHDLFVAGSSPDNGFLGEDASSDDRGYVWRLDGRDGRQIWMQEFSGAAEYVTTTLAMSDVTGDFVPEVVVALAGRGFDESQHSLARNPAKDWGGVYVLDSTTGERLPDYQREFKAEVRLCGVFDFSGDRQVEILVAVKRQEPTTTSLCVLAVQPGLPVLWERPYAAQHTRSALINDLDGDGRVEIVFTVQFSQGSLLDVLDGQLNELWQWRDTAGRIDKILVSDLDSCGANEIICVTSVPQTSHVSVTVLVPEF